MGKVRFGVIGLKGIGRNHIRAITSIENAELAAVADINEEVGKAVSSEYDVEWYRDYVKMLEEASIDAVSICTPHYLHHPMAMKSLEYGKHVLLEKPMAITAREADEIVEESKSRGLKVGVVFQLRLNPTSQKTKKIITEELGQIYRVCMEACFFRTQSYYNSDPWRGRWATEGGGALINQAIHMIDLLRWVMGPVDYLWAQMDTVGHDIEVEDVAVATLRFKNGALGVIEGGTALYPGLPPKFELHGVKGMAIIEGGTLRKWSIKGEEEITEEGVKKGLKSWVRPDVVPAANHGALIKDFVKSILEGRKPYVDGVKGRESLEIIRAIYKSAPTGEVVRFPVKE